jgi:hypothetical protein
MKAPYWYLITIDECPVCGRNKTYRERRYTPKPVEPSERYSYEQHYDWCDQ